MERTELEMVTELSDLWHKQTDDRVGNLIGLHEIDSELDCTDCDCYGRGSKPCWCERFEIEVYNHRCRYFEEYVKDEKEA